MIFLEENTPFPDVYNYHPMQGLVAVGGNLSAKRLIEAYSKGIFPWYNPHEDILWWCPEPRFVLFPNEVRVSKSMQKILDRKNFHFTENECFETVMRSCQTIKREQQDGTWITDELISSFCKLHNMGIAKSVEVWKEKELVGGFYGLEIGNVFCGESMFSHISNASKAGFLDFVLKNKNKYTVIDCQIHSEHLESLGAKFISKQSFLDLLT